ncbi:hypothetical protein AUK11_04425 [bacterium CG2_30_37_16]|nr:MAG: hypothetical protein AUK11_04425 [bacterium CG2_30_37_16]PIP31144.1 MAG: hypothetical protein COX25_00930 [bacterium (Candidatus Howlettbacteria) CG23_combo_of_CG06-09_8_20_14_all_37_9]PIX99796.1 MAG: hypothetical protein COZ22_01670 [bacterium (Candidatus Howlettbacteria) CG_4_10_14_3_um_filter_37_10]PJB05152.1 MAG: hypothetical protein CO123_04580 [bacterium (Candidatus Howlettbacteria) CG_4_9_14_3_um_filter_37_10]
MVEEKWLDLLDNIDEKFGISKKEKEEIEFKDDIGHSSNGTVEKIFFKTPIGELKLERTTKPMIMDKKVHYNRTSGTGGKVEYIVSDTEKTSKVTAFKKDDFENWEEINLPGGNISF